MTRFELVRALAGQKGMTQGKVAGELRALATLMRETLLAGGDFPLFGLGKLKIVKRAERGARNPKTGKRMRIPARNAIKFVPSKATKEALR